MIKREALLIWESFFGDEVRAIDPFGYEMDKNAYNDYNSDYGWNIDHIWPLNGRHMFKGSNSYKNLQPLSIYSNRSKENNTRGRIDEFRFAVNDYGTDDAGKKIGRMSIKEDGCDEFIPAYDYPW